MRTCWLRACADIPGLCFHCLYCALKIFVHRESAVFLKEGRVLFLIARRQKSQDTKKCKQIQVSLFCFLRMQCQVLTENVHEHCLSIRRWGSSTAQCFWGPRLALLPYWDERGKERRVPMPMSAGITGQHPPWGGLRKEMVLCPLLFHQRWKFWARSDIQWQSSLTSHGTLIVKLLHSQVWGKVIKKISD